MDERKAKKRKKGVKALIIISSVFVMLCALAVSTLTILDLSGVIELTTDTTRFYTITFYNGTEKFESIKYQKGTIVRDPAFIVPQKACQFTGFEYVFAGWDMNKDGTPDSFGFRIYSNIEANAVFGLMPKGTK